MDIKAEFSTLKRLGLKQYLRHIKSERHYNTRAWWDVLTYDPDTGRYRLDRTTMTERDVPEHVLPVTGDSHHYTTCTFERPEKEMKREDGTYRTTPTVNYLYYKSNAINDAMTSEWKAPRVNVKLLAMLGIGGVIVFYILFNQGLIG